MKTVISTGQDLTLGEFALVYREDVPVALSEQAKQNVTVSHEIVDQIVDEDRVVYGVATGFGKFSDVVISSDEYELLQRNPIITYVVGVGNPLSRDVAHGMLLLRINNVAKGSSEYHTEVVDILIEMLDEGATPQIPEKGSLGASDNLAPLAHIVLPIIGLGQAEYKGETLDGVEAMKCAGILVVELSVREGLTLINGTPAMTSAGALTVYNALELLRVADAAATLSSEAHNGIVSALDERIRVVHPRKGQMDTAKTLRQLLSSSRNTTYQGEIHVQDAYSLRCILQTHGAGKDTISFVKQKVEIEINSATDDPIILKGTMGGISDGDFHGQSMALPFDFLGIAIAELADVSERRMKCLASPALSDLPAFLTKDGGVNSGFVVIQCSAAALVSENRVLAHPASVDNIPSSTNREDHASAGTIATCKACEILGSTRRVLAMELICVCQAIDICDDKGMGVGTKPAYDTICALMSKLGEDRLLYEDISLYESILIDGNLISHVEEGVSEIEL